MWGSIRAVQLGFVAFLLFAGVTPWAQQSSLLVAPKEGDYVAHDFHFKSGESLPELRLHYSTLGTPVRDAKGRVTNAVMLLHGTTGSGSQFLVPPFAGVLFEAGQLLDASRYYIILPDNIGHGKSSKPSDGMHAHFPQYDYNDMVAAQHELLEKELQGRFVLIPISEQTHGHGTHTQAAVWQQYLKELLDAAGH